MIINNTKNSRTLITPQSELELKLLDSNLFKSKIAYELSSNNAADDLMIQLSSECQLPIICNDKSIMLATDLADTKRLTYLLRTVVDFSNVIHGCLPLHAAYVQSKNNGVILTADTGKGKSLMFNEYVKQNYALAGDDHIIIKDSIISGNTVARIRNKQGESSYISINTAPLKMNPYSMVLVDVSGKENISEVSKNNWINDSTINECILKYLTQDINYNGKKYNMKQLFGEEIINNYLSMYNTFVNNAKHVIKISGSPEFMKSRIDVILNEH